MANFFRRGFRAVYRFIIGAAAIRDVKTEASNLYGTYSERGRDEKDIYNETLEAALGGEHKKHKEHKVNDPTDGSLRVLLHCFTEKKFLEVLEDFKSGKTKERLEKEFLNIGIKTEGLVVEIENIEQIKERAAAISR